MITDLTDEAIEYGRQAHRAIEAAGGDQLVAQAEQDPTRREALVVPLLAELGAWDLTPRQDRDELEAAAALCHRAGWWTLPYPVAERLCRPADLDAVGLVLVGEPGPAAPLLGLDGDGSRWAAATLDGRRSLIASRPPTTTARKSAFVVDVDLEAVEGVAAPAELALGLVLGSWTLLGMLDRAMELTRAYVQQREQFSQPLASFQGVQFQLTDAEVERCGVEELAKYALWSIEAGRHEVLDDALALRLAAIEAADVVLRVTHQLHGAIGFCDETTLSWLSRYSQPLRRLPLGLAATRQALTRQIMGKGLTGLFDARSASR
jgi:hypothetical protein